MFRTEIQGLNYCERHAIRIETKAHALRLAAALAAYEKAGDGSPEVERQ